MVQNTKLISQAELKEIRQDINTKAPQLVIDALTNNNKRKELARYLRHNYSSYINKRKEVTEYILQELVGTGFIEDLLLNPKITDIGWNGTFLTVETNDEKLALTNEELGGDINDEYIEKIIQRFATQEDKEFNGSYPILDALQNGLRLSATHKEHSPYGHTMSIRITRPKLALNQDNFKIFAPDFILDFISKIMLARANVTISGTTGTGKSLVNGTPIRVADNRGYVNIEDLKVGDKVFDRNNEPTRVKGVYPQGLLPVYRVTFEDGSSLDVNNEHLWGINLGGKETTLRTSEIKDKLSKGDKLTLPKYERLKEIDGAQHIITESNLGIVEVEDLKVELEQTCIRVEHKDHLFQAGNQNILTHNTELQKLMMSYIPATERIIMIEDVLETHAKELFPDKDIYSWITGVGYEITDFVKASLRNNPKWIMVSETRGAEAYEMLQAILTGNNIVTTLHSINAEAVPKRFANMIANGYKNANEESLMNDILAYFNFAFHIEKVFIRDEVTGEGKLIRYLEEIREFSSEGAIPVFKQRFFKGDFYVSTGKLSNEYQEILGKNFLEYHFPVLDNVARDDLGDTPEGKLLEGLKERFKQNAGVQEIDSTLYKGYEENINNLNYNQMLEEAAAMGLTIEEYEQQTGVSMSDFGNSGNNGYIDPGSKYQTSQQDMYTPEYQAQYEQPGYQTEQQYQPEQDYQQQPQQQYREVQSPVYNQEDMITNMQQDFANSDTFLKQQQKVEENKFGSKKPDISGFLKGLGKK